MNQPRRPAPSSLSASPAPSLAPSRRGWSSPRTTWLALLGSAIAGLAGARIAAADSPRDTFRYPYDPVCSWGRVANGKGMIVRCLTRVEAEALGAAAGPPRAVPGASASASAERAAPASSSAAGATSAPRPLVVEVGPVLVDEGKLPQALGKLKAPADRYLACVRDHGGLSRDEGEIHVRFLVRERGRAEGTVVSKRAGVSEAAARCVADVVDRRFVGSPEAAMAGATLVVKVRESLP
jgi:hypothetical protein